MTEALKKRNYLLCPLLLLLTGWIIFRETSPKLLWTCLTQVKPLFLIAGGLCTALFLACEASNLGFCLKQCGHPVSFRKQMRYALTGFFFRWTTYAASVNDERQDSFFLWGSVPGSRAGIFSGRIGSSCWIQSAVLPGFYLRGIRSCHSFDCYCVCCESDLAAAIDPCDL